MINMMLFRVLLGCTVLLRKNIICDKGIPEITNAPMKTAIEDTLKNGVEWIGDGITNAVETIVPIGESVDLFEGRSMCRKHKKHPKKNKFLVPLLIGFLLIKSILLPIALKAVAVLSGKAFVLSLMSLILAAIVGLRRIAGVLPPTGFSNDGYSKYRRKDQVLDERNNFEDEDPYRYYREQRRRK